MSSREKYPEEWIWNKKRNEYNKIFSSFYIFLTENYFLRVFFSLVRNSYSCLGYTFTHSPQSLTPFYFNISACVIFGTEQNKTERTVHDYKYKKNYSHLLYSSSSSHLYTLDEAADDADVLLMSSSSLYVFFYKIKRNSWKCNAIWYYRDTLVLYHLRYHYFSSQSLYTSLEILKSKL